VQISYPLCIPTLEKCVRHVIKAALTTNIKYNIKYQYASTIPSIEPKLIKNFPVGTNEQLYIETKKNTKNTVH
jgi:hypothetical protein